MKKLYSLLQFILVLIVLPLIYDLKLIITWPIISIIALISILILSQPAMDLKESKANDATDRGTMLLIAIVSSIGQIVGIMDWAYLQSSPIKIDWISILGLSMMSFGLAFRLWAIKTLKDAFSATVQIKKGQSLITSGPYKWFRHPSYTGAWILMLGDAILLKSWPSIIIMGVIMLWVYNKRIETEEQTLANAFGIDYIKHERNTWKMLPGW